MEYSYCVRIESLSSQRLKRIRRQLSWCGEGGFRSALPFSKLPLLFANFFTIGTEIAPSDCSILWGLAISLPTGHALACFAMFSHSVCLRALGSSYGVSSVIRLLNMTGCASCSYLLHTKLPVYSYQCIVSLFTASAESLKCHGLLATYRFACSHARIALRMLDILRKARIALSFESLAVSHKLSDVRFYQEHLRYDVDAHFR